MNFKVFFLICFTILIFSCNKKTDIPILLIQPYENFDKELVLNVKKSIEKNYGFKVYVAENIEMPQSAYTNIKSPRYRAEKC